MACLQLSQENRWPIHHSGHGALVLAALRHVAVHLLEQVEARSKAAANRRLAVRPREALPLLFT